MPSSYVEFKLGGGLNQKSAPSDIADGQLQKAVGCRFDKTGAVSSDLGRTELSDFSGKILGHVDTYRTGSKGRITKNGSTITEDGSTIGTFSSTGYLSGVDHRGVTYLADGENLKVWDGTTLRTVGLDAPATAATLAVSGSGSNLAVGTYKVRYTFVVFANDTLYAESNFSPNQSVTVNTAGEQIDVTALEAAPSHATHIRIYRTDTNGTAFYFDQEIDSSLTTATITGSAGSDGGLPPGADDDATQGDSVTDERDAQPSLTKNRYTRFKTTTDLRNKWNDLDVDTGDGPRQDDRGSQLVMTNLGLLGNWTDHDAPPTDLRHLVYHQEQVFAIEDSTNNVRFSRLSEPEHWPLFNAVRPGRRSAETLLSILPLGDSIVAYTDSGIYRLDPVGLAFEDIRMVDVASPVGLAAEWGVTPIQLGTGQVTAHVFIAQSGLYIFDGQNVTEISFNVEGIFTGDDADNAINFSRIGDAVAVSQRDRVWLSYASGSSTTNDRTLFVDFQDPQSAKFSILPYGYSTLALERKDQIPVGGDSEGSFYQVATGNTNGGANIVWNPKSKEFPLTGQNTLAALESVTLDIDLGGIESVITFSTDSGYNSTITKTDSGRQDITIPVPHWLKGNRAAVEVYSSGQGERHWYGLGFRFRGGEQGLT